MKFKHLIACISVTILAFGALGGAVAQTAPYTFENGTSAASRGVIEIGGGAKFDSRDLGAIYTEVSTGKRAIETAISNAGLEAPSKTGSVYTFAELATGINPWDDLQNGLGYYAKDSEGNITKSATKRTTLYNAVNSIDSLDRAIAADNVSYAENLPQQTLISYGYFALDLHTYGTSSQATTHPKPYTFTYNIKTLSRFYGISYQSLTADDFIVGYKSLNDGAQVSLEGSSNGQGGYFYAYSHVGTPSVAYDAENGILTVSNIFYWTQASYSHPYATGGGNYYAQITSNDIICMLVPQAVRVD